MRKLGLFFASLAIALHALWPLIAQAKPKSVALVPLCTVGGETHYQEVPLGDSPAEQRSASHFEHCSLCTPGAAFLVFPVHRFDLADGRAYSPPGTGSFSIKTRQTSRAHSRGPPLSTSVDAMTDEPWREREETSAVQHGGDRAARADSRHRLVRRGVLRA